MNTVTAFRRQGAYQPIFLLTLMALSLDTHSLYLAAYLSEQCSPLKSLLLEFSIQQGGSVESILSQSVKISDGLESILFILRLAFCLEGQPARLKTEGH